MFVVQLQKCSSERVNAYAYACRSVLCVCMHVAIFIVDEL